MIGFISPTFLPCTMTNKTILTAILMATLLLSLASVSYQEVEAKKPHKPNLKERVADLEANATAQHAEIDALQAAVSSIDLSGITAAIAALSGQITNILTILDTQDDRITTLEQDSGGATYDDTQVKADIATLQAAVNALNSKTKAYTVNAGAITPAAGTMGASQIHFASIDYANCQLNNVVFDSNRYASYGWCPQSENAAFFIPLPNATSTTLVNISVGNAPTGSDVPNCIKYKTGLITAQDGDGQAFSQTGILAVCDKTLKAGELLTYDWTNP